MRQVVRNRFVDGGEGRPRSQRVCGCERQRAGWVAAGRGGWAETRGRSEEETAREVGRRERKQTGDFYRGTHSLPCHRRRHHHPLLPPQRPQRRQRCLWRWRRPPRGQHPRAARSHFKRRDPRVGTARGQQGRRRQAGDRSSQRVSCVGRQGGFGGGGGAAGGEGDRGCGRRWKVEVGRGRNRRISRPPSALPTPLCLVSLSPRTNHSPFNVAMTAALRSSMAATAARAAALSAEPGEAGGRVMRGRQAARKQEQNPVHNR